MRALSTIVALATTVQLASSQFSGFNYGSTFTTGAPKQQGDFEAEFRRAASLSGAPVGFNSARLYTMVQAGTANDPISAIPAAISTKTTLLLGLWASAGDAAFANELTALKRTIQQYGSSLSGLVAGISVGSEDLYRNSPTGQLNKENPGAEPAKIVDYIRQVREAVAGTPLSGVPIGHVDTWTEWVNLGRNQIVVNAVDFLGFDAYPYFETTAAQGNAIEQNKALFDSALAATRAAAGGRPVWITETGFPVSGKTSGQAVPGIQNARVFWEQVGCSILGKMNVWWYTLQDAAPQTPNPSFGIVNSEGNQLYDLSCTNVGTSTSSTPSPPPPASTGSSNGSGSGSGLPTSRSNDPQPPASSGSGSSTTGTTGGSGGPAPTTGGSGSSAPTTGGSGSSAPTTSRAIDGGSPGAGNGLGSSQLSIQTQTTMTSRSVPTTTGTGSGSGSGSGNGTLSTPSPSPSVPVPGSGASALKKTGSIGAAFAAVLGAALVL